MFGLGYGLDPTIILVIPAAIFAMWAQFKVSSTFNKFGKVANSQGYTGADVARMLLERAGVYDVKVEHIRGSLTDHYDPRTKTLRLSDAVFGSPSVAALGVAAHETGHAIQHNVGYAPLSIRSAIAPAASLSSTISMPLVLVGFLLAAFAGSFGLILVEVGIVLFTVVLVFQVVTLPVEFNASNRALEMLEENRILSQSEIAPAKKVLSAAAMTYVAAVAVSLTTLLRYLLIFSGMRRDD